MEDQERSNDSLSIRLRQPGLIVYLCGIGTSILTILAVQRANRNGVDVMGWFINAILPVGAILVGIASGLGFAVGSRLLNVKLGSGFLAVMFATGIVVYFCLQYLTYTSLLAAAEVPADRYT